MTFFPDTMRSLVSSGRNGQAPSPGSAHLKENFDANAKRFLIDDCILLIPGRRRQANDNRTGTSIAVCPFFFERNGGDQRQDG